MAGVLPTLRHSTLNVPDHRVTREWLPWCSGDALPGVAEVGDDLEFAAEGADVVGQGGQFGDGAVLDGGDALLGHAHGLGDLGLDEAGSLAYLGEVLRADRQDPPVVCLVQGGAVVGVDELVRELLAGLGEELGLLAHRCPFRYASYRASAAGMAPAYHSFHRPDLLPATSSTALRTGRR